MNKPKLLPCPFCGKSDSVVLLDESGRLHYVCCTGQKGGCGARTTLCEKEITAVVTWNRRVPLPDNKALTVEELRGMDGEPVYIVCDPDADGEQLVMWALVEVDADGGEVYLTNNLGGRTEFLHSEDFDGMHIYRRPPEKGE